MSSSRPCIAPRAQGPIRIASYGLPRLPDGSRRPRGWVDVGPLRGTEIIMTRGTAITLLGTNFVRMEKLIDAGVVEKVAAMSAGRNTFVRMDPGVNLHQLYERWVARRGMPVTHIDFSLHRSVRRWCQVPTSTPFPEIVLEGAFQRLAEIGAFNRVEINMFLELGPENFEQVLDWVDRRLGRQRLFFTPNRPGPVPLPMFKASLPAAILGMPRTCFSPDRGRTYEAPSERVRRRIWQLNELYETTALYALVTAPRLRRPDQLREHVNAMSRVEEVMRAHAGAAPWTKEQFDAALSAYVLDGFGRPQDPPAIRELTVRLWRMVVGRLHLRAKQLGSARPAGLETFLPPKYVFKRGLADAILAKFGDLRKEGRSSRKRDTEQALIELEAILAAVENRRDEMRTFGTAFRKAVDDLVAGGTEREFGVDVPILDGKGQYIGGRQTAWFRIWTVGEAWNSLATTAVATKKAVVNHTGADVEADGRYVVEHLRTVGRQGSNPDEPWMIRLDRLCVAHGNLQLPDDLKEERHAAIRDADLPGAMSVSGGLLRFGEDLAFLKQNGLVVGRHFVPLEEIECAIRLAFHLVDCVSQSFNRGQEVRQQVRRDWTELDLDSDESWHIQKVWPKVPKRKDLADCPKVPLTLRETSLNEALDLCEVDMRRFGFDTFPVMPAPRDLQWKCPPGEYVVSVGGKTLTMKDCWIILRYLFVGWPPFTLHDFRHVMAEDAALDHVPKALIALMLSDTEDVAEDYMELPEWALAIIKRERKADRMDKQDERLAAQRAQANER